MSRPVDLQKGEHLHESFLKLNPMHTVPVLDDNGEVIVDSHAICTYIIDKYGRDDALYPMNFAERARIHQRLHFNSSVLFKAYGAATVAIIKGAPEASAEQLESIHSALGFLETFLQTGNYVVGSSLTVADFCLVTTVTTLLVHVTLDSYPRIQAWINRLSELPYFEEQNTKLVEDLCKVFEAIKGRNRLAAAAAAAE